MGKGGRGRGNYLYKLSHDHDDGDWILGFGLKDFHREAVLSN